MDMSTLRVFAAVARDGGVTPASRALGTVPSNVTTRIQELEREIGLPLFERHSRGMSLTPAGERLRPYAERLAALMAEAKQAAQDEGAPRGPLRLGAMETTAAVRLPPLLATYHRAFPEVRLALRTGPTAQLVEAVLARELDGAFVAGPIAHAGLTALPAFLEELVLVSPPGVTLAALSPSALTTLVFEAGCSYRQRLEQVLTRRGFPVLARQDFGSVEGILGCVAAGMGVTMLPRAAVEASALRDQVMCEAIPGEEGRAATLFILRAGTHRGAAMRGLLDLLVPDSSLILA